MPSESERIDYSRRVILRWQQPGGGYPACPTMPDYQFSWFRDGSFIAYAMLLCGEVTSAGAFHEWAARVVLRHQPGARRAMEDYRAGRRPADHDLYRARYTYDGDKGPDDWPEYQLDGLGTWLWSLDQFATATRAPLSATVQAAAQFVADYLAVLWPTPCHDLWEEHVDRVHTYTLAAILCGLHSAGRLFKPSRQTEAAAEAIRTFLDTICRRPDGTFMKSLNDERVDASLIGLAVPYAVVSPDDPAMRGTIARIEHDLYVEGIGVHRYLGDTYYGGGAWPLLAAWLGWYEAARGCPERTRAIVEAMLNQSARGGDLPEQIAPPMLADVSYHTMWEHKRGPIATPLLWAHAMLLIAHHAAANLPG